MEIIAIISSLIANGITSVAKPARWQYNGPNRTIYIRAFNALVGIITMVVMALIFGVEMSTDSLGANLDLLGNALLTFAASQGWFKLAENSIN